MANIREKIEKLLALATSSNENEAKAALLKAKELMAKHKLSEVDFEDAKKQELKHFLCEDVSWTTDSGNIWIVELSELICGEYLCVSAWQTKRGTRTHTLVISGLEDDLQICSQVVGYAVGFVENTIRELKRKYSKTSSDTKSITRSYAEGFISGLKQAFEDQREKHAEWGLVMVKPEEVKEYENRLGTREVGVKKTGFDPLAYLRGQRDGLEFNKRKVLEG